ncbi:MAG: hypothetical protein ACP5NS_03415 [Candidatus Pacearchaeota archaeon]
MKLKSVRRKLIATIFFSLIASVGLIIHGVFFDAKLEDIKRLSIEGFFLTFLVAFPTLLLLEWIFDLENKEEFKILERRVTQLEKRK